MKIVRQTAILTLVIVFSHLSAYAQKNAFSECIEYALQQFIMRRDTICNLDKNLANSVYICLDGMPTTDIHLQNTKIVMFSLMNFGGLPKNIRTKLKQGLSVVFISVSLIKNKLYVYIAPKNVTMKNKKKLEISFVHSYSFEFVYIDTSNQWILEKDYNQSL